MKSIPIYISNKAFTFARKNSIDRKTIQKGERAYCVHYRTAKSAHGCFTFSIDNLFKFVQDCSFPSGKDKEMFLLSISSKIPLAEANIFYDWRFGRGAYSHWSDETE